MICSLALKNVVSVPVLSHAFEGPGLIRHDNNFREYVPLSRSEMRLMPSIMPSVLIDELPKANATLYWVSSWICWIMIQRCSPAQSPISSGAILSPGSRQPTQGLWPGRCRRQGLSQQPNVTLFYSTKECFWATSKFAQCIYSTASDQEWFLQLGGSHVSHKFSTFVVATLAFQSASYRVLEIKALYRSCSLLSDSLSVLLSISFQCVHLLNKPITPTHGKLISSFLWPLPVYRGIYLDRLRLDFVGTLHVQRAGLFCVSPSPSLPFEPSIVFLKTSIYTIVMVLQSPPLLQSLSFDSPSNAPWTIRKIGSVLDETSILGILMWISLSYVWAAVSFGLYCICSSDH